MALPGLTAKTLRLFDLFRILTGVVPATPALVLGTPRKHQSKWASAVLIRCLKTEIWRDLEGEFELDCATLF
ncbi:MAG: hypothetical protein J5I81_11910 [Nitrococcus mobilis]|nr:hypothetical protein [Nitrococcus mobilis]